MSHTPLPADRSDVARRVDYDDTGRRQVEHIERTRVERPVVVVDRRDDDVQRAVAIEVTQRCDVRTEIVEVLERPGDTVGSRPERRLSNDRTRSVEVQQQHQPAVVAAQIGLRGSDHDVGIAVLVGVAHTGDAVSEPVAVQQAICEAAGAAGNHRLGFHRAVGVQHQHIGRTPVGAARVVAGGADKHVVRPVAVDVAHGAYRIAEEVGVGQRSNQTACGVADLGLRRDRSAGGQVQHVDGAGVQEAVVVALGSHGYLAAAVTI
ncbi:MAG: hypothetical protein R2770_20600 [Acidimicrobiales bacterium]